MKQFVVLLFDVFVSMLLFVAGIELQYVCGASKWMFAIFLSPMVFWVAMRSPDIRAQFHEALFVVLALNALAVLGAVVEPLGRAWGLPREVPGFLIGMLFVWIFCRVCWSCRGRKESFTETSGNS